MLLVVLILHSSLRVHWVDNLYLLFQKTGAVLLADVSRGEHRVCRSLVCLLLVASFTGDERVYGCCFGKVVSRRIWHSEGSSKNSLIVCDAWLC